MVGYLTRGGNLSCFDSLDTPLYKAAEDGQVEEVERLIKARRNVDKAGSR